MLTRFSGYKPRIQARMRKSYTAKPIHELKDEELYNRLVLTVISVIGITILLIVSVVFLGPKIGGVFGFLSKYRYMRAEGDKIAPSAPIFTEYPEATKEDKITLKGFAEPGSTVKLFVNGPEKQSVLTDGQGVFTLGEVQINQGKNTIFAKAVDAAGNTSVTSVTISIVSDKDKPKIEILSPKNGDIVKNLDGRIIIKGKLNEKAAVKVNGSIAIVKPDLTFEIVLGVGEGNVAITVEATDDAGNKDDAKISVIYQKGS